MLQVGTTFANRYRVERRIAGGGMGSVYEVTDLNIDRRCALKVMLPELANDARLRERFALEARIPGRAESDHIVQVVDAGLEASSNHLFLVMELLRGEDLAQKLEREKRLTPAEALTCLRQLASALVKTHALGIIHRDLKPQNLFVGRREDGTLQLKVLDFGISKVLQETSVGSQRTEVMGSPQYMAPEQFAGQVPTPATDIFALGMIAYTLLVGDSYWSPEAERFHNPIAFGIHVAKGVRESAVARALQMGKQLPARFDEWFFKVTHIDPERRYATAAEAVQALATVLNDGEASGMATLERMPNTMPLPPVVGTDTMRPMESSGPLVRTAASFVKPKTVAVSLGVLLAVGAIALGFEMNGEPEAEPNEVLPTAGIQGAPMLNTEVTADKPLQGEPTPADTPQVAPSATTPAVGESVSSMPMPSMQMPSGPASSTPVANAPVASIPAASAKPSSNAPNASTVPAATSVSMSSKPVTAPLTKPTVVTSAAPKPVAATSPTPKPVQPAATKTLCFYALSSGRIVRYVPGQTKGSPKTFPCRSNGAGQYTKVP